MALTLYFMKLNHTTSTKHPSRIKHGFLFSGHPQISLRNFSAIKGISPPFLERASMTVEAAVVLPLFLFFFINLLSVIEIYGLQTTIMSALRETGNELCVYAYAYDRVFQEEDDEGLEAFAENIAFSYLYVRQRVKELCGEEYLDRSPLVGGEKGLIYADSSVLQKDDCIDLVVSYKVAPVTILSGYSPGWFSNRYYARAWTGYDICKNNEEMVYVAEYARVYHKDPKCSHICLSIREVRREDVYEMRNAYGGKYTACEKCRDNGKDKIYITGEGERYHTDPDCSGLKRTISRIPISDARSKYRACERCAH